MYLYVYSYIGHNNKNIVPILNSCNCNDPVRTVTARLSKSFINMIKDIVGQLFYQIVVIILYQYTKPKTVSVFHLKLRLSSEICIWISIYMQAIKN